MPTTELNSVFTGHRKENRFLHRIGFSDETEPTMFRVDDETVEPIFRHCSTAIEIKYAIFRKVDASLNDLKTTSFNKILSYLKRLNLLDELEDNIRSTAKSIELCGCHLLSKPKDIYLQILKWLS